MPAISFEQEQPGWWSSHCVNIHHIKPADVVHCPSLEVVLKSFFEWATVNWTILDVVLVAHNCGFD